MKFKVTSELKYKAKSDGTIVINISALKTPNQTIIHENLTLNPYIKVDELSTKYAESRLVRFEIDKPGDIQINYEALVDSVTKIKDYGSLKETPVAKLHTSILP